MKNAVEFAYFGFVHKQRQLAYNVTLSLVSQDFLFLCAFQFMRKTLLILVALEPI